MVTTRSSFVVAAIAAIGLSGWMAPQKEGAAGPGAGRPAGTSSAAASPQFLLLTDGRLIQGIISEEDNQVVVSQPVGAMRFPRKRVERIFPSIRKVYEYKLEQLPENDDDERLKLARWCLAQNLVPETRAQLEAILAHSPKHLQAKAMIVSLDQAHERRAGRVQDPEVERTGGQREPLGGEDRPGTLDASVISGARRGMGMSETPVVFDLPPAQAVRRAEEFVRYVHPVVQVYCARCHNDQYNGSFQLLPFRTKADRTRDALKANLDACLRLVDRENPTRSELLASSLRPHGRGPSKKPIFQGSNDRAYQILATWVNKLQAPRGDDAVNRASRTSPGDGGDERFASAKGRVRGDVGTTVGDPIRFPTGPVDARVLPPVRYEPGKGMVPDDASPGDFPLPFGTTGQKPEAARSGKLPESRCRTRRRRRA